MTNYFAFLDALTADAEASQAGQILKAAGFAVYNSGGNCMVWHKEAPDHRTYVMLSVRGDETTEDVSELGIGLDDLSRDVWQVGIYESSDAGLYDENDDRLTLAQAIAWGEAALANPAAHLADGEADNNKLKRVCGMLEERGISASFEYPGFIYIALTHGALSFGDANGPFGWDLRSHDGRNLDAGESEMLVNATLAMDLADYVEKVTRELQAKEAS